jgi:hypothetical protein
MPCCSLIAVHQLAIDLTQRTIAESVETSMVSVAFFQADALPRHPPYVIEDQSAPRFAAIVPPAIEHQRGKVARRAASRKNPATATGRKTAMNSIELKSIFDSRRACGAA